MSEWGEAELDGAKLQPNSGRGTHKKGDAVMDDYVVDYKEYSRSFSISRKVWTKVTTDAMKVGIHFKPLIKLVLDGKIRLAIVDWDEFMELKEKAWRYDDLNR